MVGTRMTSVRAHRFTSAPIRGRDADANRNHVRGREWDGNGTGIESGALTYPRDGQRLARNPTPAPSVSASRIGARVLPSLRSAWRTGATPVATCRGAACFLPIPRSEAITGEAITPSQARKSRRARAHD